MKIISFDIATKSLAVSIINYNYNIDDAFKLIKKKYDIYLNFKKDNSEIHKLYKKYHKLLCDIDDILLNMIIIEYIDVSDLIPGKKLKETNIIERTQKLYDYLATFDKILEKYEINKEDTTQFLIEYQMGPNDKSRVISSQILLHIIKYGNLHNTNIHMIGPTLKNTLYLLNDDNSKYSSFTNEYNTNYAANKNHSKYNFLKILNNYNYTPIIKDIKKKNIDDIADSVLMSISFAIKNNYI